MKQYQRGETAILACETRLTTTNVLTSPSTSYVIDVTDSEGTAKATAQAMTAGSAGKLSYSLAIASDAALGIWKGTWTMTSGAIVTKANFEFEVLDRFDVD
jgi:hypothetical protein